MSTYDSPSEFPDPKFIFQWSMDSKKGLCCGIFGCPNKVLIECEICGGGYCKEHKSCHFHSESNTGVLIK